MLVDISKHMIKPGVTVSSCVKLVILACTGSVSMFCLCWFARCTLRFPSTNVRITFQALHGSADNIAATSSATVSSPAKPLQPLHISIPKPAESVSVFASPCPSPTGTIRFAVCHIVVTVVLLRTVCFMPVVCTSFFDEQFYMVF